MAHRTDLGLLGALLFGALALTSVHAAGEIGGGVPITADCKDRAILSAATHLVELLKEDRSLCTTGGLTPLNVTGYLVFRKCLMATTQVTVTINYDIKMDVAEYQAAGGQPKVIELGGVVAYNPVYGTASKAQKQQASGQAWTVQSCMFRNKPMVTPGSRRPS